MKKIIIPSLLCSLLLANELDILQKDKKELRQIEKEVIQKKYEGAKDDWIGTINLNSGLTRNHSFSKDNDSFSKSISIGFTQSVAVHTRKVPFFFRVFNLGM